MMSDERYSGYLIVRQGSVVFLIYHINIKTDEMIYYGLFYYDDMFIFAL